jgi:hypothetical protein
LDCVLSQAAVAKYPECEPESATGMASIKLPECTIVATGHQRQQLLIAKDGW